MARTQGRLGALRVSDDNRTSYEDVGALVDATLNGDQGEVKTTGHDSGQYEEALPGRKSFTIDGKCFWDEDDAGQAIILDSFLNGTVIDFAFLPLVSTGKAWGQIKGFVTKMSPGSPNDDAASFDFTIKCTGALTWGAQP